MVFLRQFRLPLCRDRHDPSVHSKVKTFSVNGFKWMRVFLHHFVHLFVHSSISFVHSLPAIFPWDKKKEMHFLTLDPELKRNAILQQKLYRRYKTKMCVYQFMQMYEVQRERRQLTTHKKVMLQAYIEVRFGAASMEKALCILLLSFITFITHINSRHNSGRNWAIINKCVLLRTEIS